MNTFTFEIQFVSMVSQQANDAHQALQLIAEHFDGHIITREISATMDSEWTPVLYEIDGEEVRPTMYPLSDGTKELLYESFEEARHRKRVPRPSDFGSARSRACELLQRAARLLLEAEKAPDAPAFRDTALVVSAIDICWKNTRDLNVDPQPPKLDSLIDDLSMTRDLIERAQRVIDPIACGEIASFGTQDVVKKCGERLQEARDDLSGLLAGIHKLTGGKS